MKPKPQNVWIVERKTLYNGSACYSTPGGGSPATTTTDPNKAARFGTCAQARAFIKRMPPHERSRYRPAQHIITAAAYRRVPWWQSIWRKIGEWA